MGDQNVFVAHKKDCDESSVWHYFLTSKDGKTAQCKTCKSILKTLGGSTKGLHTHLSSRHSVKVIQSGKSGNQPSTSADVSLPDYSSNKKRKIESYFCSERDQLDDVLARMTTLDGIPFNVFITSKDLRKLLIAKGFSDLPSSEVTVRNRVVNYSKKIKNQFKKAIMEIKNSGERFSLSFDEWTSTSNKRFMNVNLHATKQTWCLGMVQIKGSFTAEACVHTLNGHLEKYGISLQKDVVAIVTDGPNVMVKVGKLLNTEHQLCFAHGIHLAVCDVLYSKNCELGEMSENKIPEEKTSTASALTPGEESNEEEEEEDEGNLDDISSFGTVTFIVDDDNSRNNVEELTSELNISSVIKKVRKVVIYFKKSPTKNESVLQKYVKQEKGTELSLLLDVKTRWNSLLAMLERFVSLKTCIQKALIDLNHPVTLSEAEFTLLSNIIEVLSPIRLTVEALCRRDSNLVTADAALKFLIKHLHSSSSSEFCVKMKTALLTRISERRKVELSGVITYLQNPRKSADESAELITSYFPLPNQNALRKQIRVLVERLEEKTPSEEKKKANDNVDEENEQVNEATNKPCPMTLKNVLQEEIEKSMEPPKPETKNLDLNSTIKKEMSLFENGGVRGHHLDLVYKYLLTIPPTSVESERVFSASGYLCNKLRSRLGAETLDALIFLRYHFQQQQKN